jgi:hypothetical protein
MKKYFAGHNIAFAVMLGLAAVGVTLPVHGALQSVWNFDSGNTAGSPDQLYATLSGGSVQLQTGGQPAYNGTYRLVVDSGSAFQIALIVPGIANLQSLTTLSFWAAKNSASPTFSVSYTLNNGSPVPLGSVVTPGTSYAQYSYPLTGINLTGLTGLNTVILTMSVASGGSVNFDQVELTGVPEPTTVAGGIFGVGCVAMSGIRMIRRRSALAAKN